MRSIKELFIIVRYNINIIEKYNIGICYTIAYLFKHGIISTDENITLKQYMRNNRPIWPSIYADPNRNDDSMYWWTPGEIKPRVRWLNYTIRKLAKEEQLANTISAKKLIDNGKFGKS